MFTTFEMGYSIFFTHIMSESLVDYLHLHLLYVSAPVPEIPHHSILFVQASLQNKSFSCHINLVIVLIHLHRFSNIKVVAVGTHSKLFTFLFKL
jgi:hypothetical protein